MLKATTCTCTCGSYTYCTCRYPLILFMGLVLLSLLRFGVEERKQQSIVGGKGSGVFGSGGISTLELNVIFVIF